MIAGVGVYFPLGTGHTLCVQGDGRISHGIIDHMRFIEGPMHLGMLAPTAF